MQINYELAAPVDSYSGHTALDFPVFSPPELEVVISCLQMAYESVLLQTDSRHSALVPSCLHLKVIGSISRLFQGAGITQDKL